MTGKLRQTARWASLLGVCCSFLGCSAADEVPHSPQAPQGPKPAAADDYEGISEIQGRLTASCTISATMASIAVADGESLLISYRSSDDKVVLNATTSSAAPCEINSTATLRVTASGTQVAQGRTVIIDYSDGLFMKGTSATTALLLIDFGTVNSSDTLQVRGSPGADKFTLGAGTGTTRALNVNAGSGAGLDAFADVTFKSIETVLVSAGAGNDVIDAAGGAGTGTAFPTAVQLLGGDDNDTLSGGAGNDILTSGDGNDTMDGNAGNDTFRMGAISDGADTINITGTTPGTDTVDYSSRTNGVTINVDGTASSGEGEGDSIPDKMAIIIGGKGSDNITIGASSTLAHVVYGGLGDDTFTGGLGADVFDGQLGGDTCIGDKATMTYATRTAPLTITIDTSADDGAAAASGTSATASNPTGAADGLVTIVAPTGALTGTEGRMLKLSGFTGTPANDDATTGYPIVTVNSATSVVIDISANTSFVEADLSGSGALAWSLDAEADNVQCNIVLGGSGNDTITGDTRGNLIRGGLGNDTITGGAGDDLLSGDDGDDTIYGGDGNDTVVGGNGNDPLYGGDGNDILQGDAGIDVLQCDGDNAAGDPGMAPGEADFTVDRNTPSTETVAGCEH